MRNRIPYSITYYSLYRNSLFKMEKVDFWYLHAAFLVRLNIWNVGHEH
jgi:hypothetical protein